ncbi:hypothetical protein BUC_7044 [Burkholderia pseudomallei 576]|nr:hypothetical protein BUC_7044 [Burkholderia pseudomallei 576]
MTGARFGATRSTRAYAHARIARARIGRRAPARTDGGRRIAAPPPPVNPAKARRRRRR